MTITELSPLVRRITAGNSSVFTGPGTNTYLVGKEEITVIDPNTFYAFAAVVLGNLTFRK